LLLELSCKDLHKKKDIFLSIMEANQ